MPSSTVNRKGSRDQPLAAQTVSTWKYSEQTGLSPGISATRLTRGPEAGPPSTFQSASGTVTRRTWKPSGASISSISVANAS